MFKTIVITSPNLDKVEKTNVLYINQGFSKISIYYLKFEAYIDEAKDFECIVRIIDELEHQKVIERKRFFNKASFIFKCKDATSLDIKDADVKDVCLIFIEYEFPNFKKSDPPIYLDIEIIEFDSKIIDSMNTKPQIKEDIYDLVDKYLSDDFKGAISEIGTIGEYIAREFAEKIHNKKVGNFRTALNILTNEKKLARKKINYFYLGSLLWPIYYIRNQKSHPYHKIEFDKSTAKIAMENLSSILNYLAKTKFKF